MFTLLQCYCCTSNSACCCFRITVVCVTCKARCINSSQHYGRIMTTLQITWPLFFQVDIKSDIRIFKLSSDYLLDHTTFILMDGYKYCCQHSPLCITGKLSVHCCQIYISYFTVKYLKIDLA